MTRCHSGKAARVCGYCADHPDTDDQEDES